MRPNTGCPLTKRASHSLLNKKEHEENGLLLASRILRHRSQLALEYSYRGATLIAGNDTLSPQRRDACRKCGVSSDSSA